MSGPSAVVFSTSMNTARRGVVGGSWSADAGFVALVRRARCRVVVLGASGISNRVCAALSFFERVLERLLTPAVFTKYTPFATCRRDRAALDWRKKHRAETLRHGIR
jgi:hypothetical protein